MITQQHAGNLEQTRVKLQKYSFTPILHDFSGLIVVVSFFFWRRIDAACLCGLNSEQAERMREKTKVKQGNVDVCRQGIYKKNQLTATSFSSSGQKICLLTLMLVIR